MIKDYLFLNQDLEYLEFTKKFLPKDLKEEIIGVRIPILRKYAKDIKDTEESNIFLNDLPHKYHEENLLHGYLLTLKIKDINEYLNRLNEFLPYIDNWCVTDTINPKIFNKYPNESYKEIKRWLKSKDEYTVRFAIVSLLQYFLKENFRKEELELVSKIKKDTYYINMASAWFYSMSLVNHYNDTIIYLENHLLSSFIHNKTIQKAIESYQISDEKKDYLRSLKTNVKKNK
jgi:3-methyladenine DNA glycosylase AlkD